jgi:SAM-dependent methyltransferase
MNLASYVDGDDSHAFRDIRWIELNFLPQVEDIFKKNDSILDIGCGNGRMFPILSKYFSKVIGIDPFEKVLDKFLSSTVLFFPITLDEFFSDKKIDVLFFNQSLSGLIRFAEPKYTVEELVEKMDSILSEHGYIIILDWPSGHPAFGADIKSEEWINCFNKHNLFLEKEIIPEEYGDLTNIFILKRIKNNDK